MDRSKVQLLNKRPIESSKNPAWLIQNLVPATTFVPEPQPHIFELAKSGKGRPSDLSSILSHSPLHPSPKPQSKGDKGTK